MAIASANPDGKPFVRVWFPGEDNVDCNRHAEMGLVFLALTYDDYDPTGVELMDFHCDDCRFIYGEYINMSGAGVPWTDQAALRSWYERADVHARMREHRLDWFDGQGRCKPYEEILQLVIDGGFATLANVDWYKSEVRRWRIVRAIKYISYHTGELIDFANGDYQEAMDYMEDSLGKLKALTELVQPAAAAR